MRLPLAVRRPPGYRAPRTLALAAITGALTGLVVAAFDAAVQGQVLERLAHTPIEVQALAPAVGLALAAVVLRWPGRGTSPSTSDEYIRSFHDRTRSISLRDLGVRLLASAATLGSGSALGFEGPSLYAGAGIGDVLQRRWGRHLLRDDTKVLLVAGAAAGVAAIFKAPATGVVFALEVPYREDNARRMLLPALVASATGYLVFVALHGTQPLFPVADPPPVGAPELGGALALGVLCGLGARLFAWAVGGAKELAQRTTAWLRVAVGGAVLALLVVSSDALFDAPLAVGSGYRVIEWATSADRVVGLAVVLLGLRLAATVATVGAGGAGGLFVPLVVAGALCGEAVSAFTPEATPILTVIGVAAFLGAGYRTPLAGVMFVAEATGQPGFVVPGLLASVAAQLVVGDASVSPYQASGRLGHLERRFRLPITAAVDGTCPTVPSDATLAELYHGHLLLHRRFHVPVVDGATYRGMISLHDLAGVPHAAWPDEPVGDHATTEWPTAEPDRSLEAAVRAMDAADVDTLPVIADGRFVGVVTSAEVLNLAEVVNEPSDR